MKFIGNGIVWDIESDKPLCEFVNGEFTTDDARIIEILTNNECKIEKVETVETVNEIKSITFEEMTVDELKVYAEEKGIDLGQSTSQKGILKKILENETE